MESLMKINDPILLALIATGFTWFMTALGAAMVFFFKEINKRVLNMMLGFAAGIMVAASFWSLLAPAIEMAEKSSLPAWLVAAIGFLSGAAFLWLADRILPHAHFFAKEGEVEGIPTNWRRSILLVFSITLHNIPEGLAVGVAFGAAANSMSETGLLAASFPLVLAEAQLPPVGLSRAGGQPQIIGIQLRQLAGDAIHIAVDGVHDVL